MHPYFLYELQRQRLSDLERRVELARIFDGEEPARTTRRRHHGGFSRLWLQRQSPASRPVRDAC